MDFHTFQAELRRIASHVQAFAVIGPALRLHETKKQADPDVEARLLAAVEAALPGELDGLDAKQVSRTLAYVTLQIEDATDRFHNADRSPRWIFLGTPHFEPTAKALAVPSAQGWLRH